jgi:hypothetical protein
VETCNENLIPPRGKVPEFALIFAIFLALVFPFHPVNSPWKYIFIKKHLGTHSFFTISHRIVGPYTHRPHRGDDDNREAVLKTSGNGNRGDRQSFELEISRI